MNPLIKKLAEEAEGTKKHVPAVWQFYDYELEKFAELLIKECIKLLPYACHSKNGCHTSWIIREHFGMIKD